MPAAIGISLGVHAVALAALALAPRRWPLAVGALALDHAMLTAAGMSPRGRLLGPNLRRLPAAAAARAEVALTFDDGPDPEVTPRVLDLLDRHRAPATFFCVGRRVDAHPRLTAEIERRGHRVENHTHRHPHGFALFGPRRMAAEIDRAQEAIAAATGRRPVFFRAPAGFRNPWLEPLLARRGMLLASWTRRGYDAVDHDAGRVLARLVRGLAGGDLLLLHDGGGPRRGTATALAVLPRLLAEIDRLGLRPVALAREHGGRWLAADAGGAGEVAGTRAVPASDAQPPFPPAASLIPHRGVMALLVAVTARPGPDVLVCRARIAADHPFANEDGASALLAVEMGAQAAGALEGLRRAAAGGSPGPAEPAPIGYLVGLRDLRLFEPALPVDTDLEVTVRGTGAAPPLARYEISVEEEGSGGARPYARGEISTYVLPRRAASI